MDKDSAYRALRLHAVQEALATSLIDRAQRIPTEFFLGEPAVCTERWRIYRGNLHALWKTTLSNAFPVMCQLVGDDFFGQLSVLYGQKFPSQSGDVNLFGQHFSDFLKSEESVCDYPYFSAVAALEWQVHKAYYAANADLLDLAAFIAIGGENLGAYALECHPAFALISSEFAAIEVYLAHQEHEIQIIEVALNTPSFGAVSRKEWQVQVTRLGAAEFAGLQALRDGASLGEALECAIEFDAELDVTKMLQNWFSMGIFIACRRKD